jgi:hypothetical protein
MNKFLGITLIVIALAIAIIPAFTDCQSQGRSLALANGGTTAMKCHWTAQAEIASGVPFTSDPAHRRLPNYHVMQYHHEAIIDCFRLTGYYSQFRRYGTGAKNGGLISAISPSGT